MSDIQKFRKAMNGFNRHDVVTYIEYLNNKHNAQVIQLNNQLAAALAAPKADTSALEAENAALKEQVASLQAALAALQAEPVSQPNAVSCTEQELEAYRRAERAERLAMDRARQTRDHANGVLADATTQVQVAAAQLEDAARTIAAQLDVYKTTVLNAGTILTDTAATLATLAPDEE